MVFSSTVFLFYFLPVTLVGYYICEKFLPGLRNLWLLGVSFVFFAWSQPQFLPVIVACVFVNYLGGYLIDRFQKNWIKKGILVGTVVLNLCSLIYFKYFNFLIDQLEKLTHTSFRVEDVILPIGISFFTFQGMSYALDVYMGRTKVQKNLLHVMLYVIVFPQLIAGPIVRYTDVEKNILSRKSEYEDVLYGSKRFIVGLFKKAVLANSLAYTTDAIWAVDTSEMLCATAWIGIIGYTLQIFFDFSGYSDMAIGLGRIMGFHFQENFNYPYISASITEFWRRWHISLSSWFRDYVYIPLGGSRVSRGKTYRNVAVVFLLTGIWHGASWNFIFWGVWHGIFNLAEKWIKDKKGAMPKTKWYSYVYTMFVVIIGWVFFRATDMTGALQYLKVMFGLSQTQTPGFEVTWYLDRYTIFVFGLAIVMSAPVIPAAAGLLKRKMSEAGYCILENTLLIGMLLYSLVRVVASTYNPFIYFQF